MPRKPKRQPARPASVDDGIKWLLEILNWRVSEYFKITGKGSQAKAGLWYDSYFGYEAARRLSRLLLWKARQHAPRWNLKIAGKRNPPAVVDIRQASGPEDLVRRQKDRGA